MKNNMLRKGLVLAIMVLFVGASVIPSISGNIGNLNELNSKQSIVTLNRGILYVGGDGPGNYTRIQDAIDNASDGDTVFVFNGTYHENVVVNKIIDLIGEDRNNTVIDGNESEAVVTVSADGVNINGFMIQVVNDSNYSEVVGQRSNNINTNRGYTINGVLIASDYNIISDIQIILVVEDMMVDSPCGIHLRYGASYNNILGNYISATSPVYGYDNFGIGLIGNCNYNNISDNIIWTPNSGIYLDGCSYNNISNNTIRMCDGWFPGCGVFLWDSNSNNISRNTFLDNYYGIYLWDSLDNNISSNNISLNDEGGIYLISSSSNDIFGNIIYKNSRGITIIENSELNNILKNDISHNYLHGIKLGPSSQTTILGNNISSQPVYGIFFGGASSDDTVTGNRIIRNGYGIWNWGSTSSTNTLIYNNYFNNTNNAVDKSTSHNTWNITKTLAPPGTRNIVGGLYLGGNYWHDYTGVDDGSGPKPHDKIDGLGDTLLPYNSSGNIIKGGDWHPLIPKKSGPPYPPLIDGSIFVEMGVDQFYTIVSTDPDGDDVYYYVDWGDGNVEEWIGPYPSGEEVTVNHTWYKKGIYLIKAKAKDIFGAEGLWGKLTIIVPRNRVITMPFPRLLERFPNMFPILRYILGLQ